MAKQIFDDSKKFCIANIHWPIPLDFASYFIFYMVQKCRQTYFESKISYGVCYLLDKSTFIKLFYEIILDFDKFYRSNNNFIFHWILHANSVRFCILHRILYTSFLCAAKFGLFSVTKYTWYTNLCKTYKFFSSSSVFPFVCCYQLKDEYKCKIITLVTVGI